MQQNRPQAPAGMGGGGSGSMQSMMQVIKQLDLTADQKQSIQKIFKQAMQDLRDAATGIQGAPAEQRREKMQDMQKIVSDARAKAESVLTSEQRAKYYPLEAKALLAQFSKRLKDIKAASAELEIADDERAKLTSIFDDNGKALDDLKTDADAVTDSDGLKSFESKLQKIQLDTRTQLLDVLGAEDLRQLMQSLRPAGAANGGQAAAGKTAPTSRPSAQ